MRNVFGRVTHSFLFLLGLLLFTLPALCQHVIGVSAILPSTNSSTIYTYSATELDYSTNLYYDAAVSGYLFQNSSLIRSGSATSGTAPLADGYMNAPVVVGANYQLESDHYLTAFYIVYIGDIPYYSNPHYYLISTGGGSRGSSSNFSSGGGDPYISSQTIFLGTTVIGISTAAPHIGGIVDWASGTTSGIRGTTGYIEVYGSNLLDVFTGGTTPSISGSGVSLYVDYASPTQVNLGYTINSSAGTGGRTLTLATRFGASNGKTFTIADPTPYIASISPSIWPAGATTSFVISGSGFGSSPSLILSGAGIRGYGIASASDTILSGWVDVDATAPTNTVAVSIRSNGYGGNPFQPVPGGGSSNQITDNATIQSVSIRMKLELISRSIGYISSTDTVYTEDNVIRVTAVRADTGAVLPSFTGTVGITEQNGTLFAENAGELPSSVSISSGGTATFTAKSHSNPNVTGDGPPPAAQIITTSYPVYGSPGYLSVPQWYISGTNLNPRFIKAGLSNDIPDWFQLMSKHIYDNASSTAKTIHDSVWYYRVGNLNDIDPYNRAFAATGLRPRDVCGNPAENCSQAKVTFDLYHSAVRRNGLPGSAMCGFSQGVRLTRTVMYHEARHAYQSTMANLFGYDGDLDFLVSSSYLISPSTFVSDTTASRSICDTNVGSGSVYLHSFKGPTIGDSITEALHALEMDAYWFVTVAP